MEEKEYFIHLIKNKGDCFYLNDSLICSKCPLSFYTTKTKYRYLQCSAKTYKKYHPIIWLSFNKDKAYNKAIALSKVKYGEEFLFEIIL